MFINDYCITTDDPKKLILIHDFKKYIINLNQYLLIKDNIDIISDIEKSQLDYLDEEMFDPNNFDIPELIKIREISNNFIEFMDEMKNKEIDMTLHNFSNL